MTAILRVADLRSEVFDSTSLQAEMAAAGRSVSVPSAVDLRRPLPVIAEDPLLTAGEIFGIVVGLLAAAGIAYLVWYKKFRKVPVLTPMQTAKLTTASFVTRAHKIYSAEVMKLPDAEEG